MTKTVLLIDHSPSFRALIGGVLRKAGFEVVEAVSVYDACVELVDRPINAIVCDHRLPELDGMTLLRYLQDSPTHAGIPFIFLSSESCHSVVQQAMEVGAACWLTKPFQPHELIATLERHVH